MTALAQLRGLRNLITPEGAWLPVSFGAVDAGGRSCPPRSKEAVRFGLLGGLIHLGGGTDDRIYAVDLIKRAVGTKWLHAWEQEPGRVQAEVVDAVDHAIALELDGDCP